MDLVKTPTSQLTYLLSKNEASRNKKGHLKVAFINYLLARSTLWLSLI